MSSYGALHSETENHCYKNMRHILLHHHLFKNAGSTLDVALEQHFKTTHASFYAKESEVGRVYPDTLCGYLEKNPEVRALSSHHFFGRDFNRDLENRLVSQKENFFFHDAVLLRHPLSRLTSMYVYYRTLPQNENPMCAAAHALSLAEFLDFLIGYHPNFVINSQVTIFGCDDYGVPPSSESLERAIARLKKVTLLGTVEEYARTMVVAEYFLQPLFGGLQLHFSRHENVSNHALLPGYDGSLQSIEAIIGAPLFSQLCDLNNLDIELCLAVRKELYRRSTYIRDFHLRVEDFFKRCEIAREALEEKERAAQEALFSASAASESKSSESQEGSKKTDSKKEENEIC